MNKNEGKRERAMRELEKAIEEVGKVKEERVKRQLRQLKEALDIDDSLTQSPNELLLPKCLSLYNDTLSFFLQFSSGLFIRLLCFILFSPFFSSSLSHPPLPQRANFNPMQGEWSE